MYYNRTMSKIMVRLFTILNHMLPLAVYKSKAVGWGPVITVSLGVGPVQVYLLKVID